MLKRHNNWMSYRFEGQNSNIKGAADSKLEVLFNSPVVTTPDYYKALFYNARMIAENFPQPFDVLVSGGIDSEIILRLNKDLGITQNAYFFRYEDKINAFDFIEATRLCDSLNIKLNVVDFNLRKFFERDAEQIYKKYLVNTVEALPHLAWHTYFDNTAIYGNAEPYITRSENNVWNVELLELDFVHSFYDQDNIIGEWYQYTPDILYNFIRLPIIQDLIENKFDTKNSSWSLRPDIHRHIWPDIRQRTKRIGYEQYGLPGSMPNFMSDFRDSVMTGQVKAGIKYPVREFCNFFIDRAQQ